MKLSGIISVIIISVSASSPAFAQCDIPAGYTNSTSIQEGDYWIGFATDKSDYAPGEMVNFYLVVKNTSAQQQSFNFGVTPAELFSVTPQSCPSAFDCEDDLYTHPAIVYYYHPGVTLEPGECEVWMHTSTASPFDMSHVGLHFDVYGGLYEVYPTLDWGIPANGLALSVYVLDDVATRATTWGAVKVRYR